MVIVVVRALEQLDARVERAAVGLEQDLNRVDQGVERVRAERATLDRHGGGEAVRRGAVDVVSDDVGRDRELDLADVADRHRVRATRGRSRAPPNAHVFARGAYLSVYLLTL